VPERIRENQAIQSTERNKLLEMESVKNVQILLVEINNFFFRSVAVLILATSVHIGHT